MITLKDVEEFAVLWGNNVRFPPKGAIINNKAIEFDRKFAITSHVRAKKVRNISIFYILISFANWSIILNLFQLGDNWISIKNYRENISALGHSKEVALVQYGQSRIRWASLV